MWEDILKRRKGSYIGNKLRSQRKPDTPFNPFKDNKGVSEAREAKRKEAAEKRKKGEDISKGGRDYRYGRCQASRSGKEPDTCIRPLQSPEKRKSAGSDPKGKICMLCEDDQSRYANTPESIWSSPEYKKGTPKDHARMLDLYVKRNPQYKR